MNTLKVYQDLVKEVEGTSSYTYAGGIFINDATNHAIIFDRNNIHLYYDLETNIRTISIWDINGENSLRAIINKHLETDL